MGFLSILTIKAKSSIIIDQSSDWQRLKEGQYMQSAISQRLRLVLNSIFSISSSNWCEFGIDEDSYYFDIGNYGSGSAGFSLDLSSMEFKLFEFQIVYHRPYDDNDDGFSDQLVFSLNSVCVSEKHISRLVYVALSKYAKPEWFPKDAWTELREMAMGR
jgi:hypothetical protein